MSLRARLAALEDESEPERETHTVQRMPGETSAECLARAGMENPCYIFPPAEPRDENGELTESWVRGCVFWDGEKIQPVGPDFDPCHADSRFYDPDPDV